MQFRRRRRWVGKIKLVLTPASQLREADILNVLGYIPYVGEFPALDFVQEIGQCKRGTSARVNLFLANKPEVTEAGINLKLGPCSRMKRSFNACFPEQRASLFPDPHPRFTGVAIAPLVKENAAWP